eukprot:scaffold22644_cov44-Cyclotella_meneghiniana.AAC.5
MQDCCLLVERWVQGYGTLCNVVVSGQQTSTPAAVSVDAAAAIRDAARLYVGDGSRIRSFLGTAG